MATRKEVNLEKKIRASIAQNGPCGDCHGRNTQKSTSNLCFQCCPFLAKPQDQKQETAQVDEPQEDEAICYGGA